MSKEQPKQVIVMRKDLNMRRGKQIAQGAHASLAAYLHVQDSKNPAVRQWVESRFTKICLYVNSEKELLDLYEQCIVHGLNVALITDAGLTEFNNVPTKTCIAIGPDYPSAIDPITGELPLL